MIISAKYPHCQIWTSKLKNSVRNKLNIEESIHRNDKSISYSRRKAQRHKWSIRWVVNQISFWLNCIIVQRIQLMKFSVSVVMDTRLVSLQDKVSTQESQSSSSSSSRSSCDVSRTVASLETLVRNLTRSQRHSGRTLRHEAGTMDRVQHTVDQIYSHLVSRGRDKIISDSPRFDYLRCEICLEIILTSRD